MPHSSHATPLAGEPLRPLGYFSIPYGERGIRTPGAFRHHWFSRPAPSTARPSLPVVEPAKVIITAFCRNVNPLFAKNQKNWVSRVSIGCQRLFAFFNGPKRKQEPHRMRPCLKRQPSKAQGFTAAAVLEEIHRAGSNLSSHTSHIIRRVQQQAAWRFSIKSPGVRVSFGRLPDCRSRDQSVPKWEKHSKNHSFFGISFWRQAGRRKVFPEIE